MGYVLHFTVLIARAPQPSLHQSRTLGPPSRMRPYLRHGTILPRRRHEDLLQHTYQVPWPQLAIESSIYGAAEAGDGWDVSKRVFRAWLKPAKMQMQAMKRDMATVAHASNAPRSFASDTGGRQALSLHNFFPTGALLAHSSPVRHTHAPAQPAPLCPSTTTSKCSAKWPNTRDAGFAPRYDQGRHSPYGPYPISDSQSAVVI
uniref:Uncharacterized protein n=1 Tax=Mycena chlorophos TaxID=658473 RepID=A0ABQ0L9R4_MYCCL|nr:predicted protein [Mycena chlorophos]